MNREKGQGRVMIAQQQTVKKLLPNALRRDPIINLIPIREVDGPIALLVIQKDVFDEVPQRVRGVDGDDEIGEERGVGVRGEDVLAVQD